MNSQRSLCRPVLLLLSVWLGSALCRADGCDPSQALLVKVIVTNRSALQRKYGQEGYSNIVAALERLIEADCLRGIRTEVVELDNPLDNPKDHFFGMSEIQLADAVVTDSSDQKANKTAVDRACDRRDAQYVLLLGAQDVIPFQELVNPALSLFDKDQTVPSDLPYACGGVDYSQDIASFLGPTRMVGRLPDIPGGTNAPAFTNLINTAANYASRTRADYESHLAISLESVQPQLAGHLQRIFTSPLTVQLASNGPDWSESLLKNRSHFILCHGDSKTPFYRAESGATAHHARVVRAKKLAEGTVASVACCYGAELFHPTNSVEAGELGMCNTYLFEGAYGFWGSSSLAFGAETANRNADLICEYFLEHVLQGATLGEAAWKARMDFLVDQFKADIPNETLFHVYDLKTFAQFNLMGDPSVRPVENPTVFQSVFVASAVATPPGTLRAAHVASALRVNRLRQISRANAGTISFAAAPKRSPLGRGIQEALESLARKAGAPNARFTSYQVQHPKAVRPEGARPLATAIHLGIARTGSSQRPPEFTVVVVTEIGGRLLAHKLQSR